MSPVESISLPSEDDFFLAISDYSNAVIRAAGKKLTCHSKILEVQSAVFKEKLEKMLAGDAEDVYEKDGKVCLDLECGHNTADVLFSFISSNGAHLPDANSAPSTLKELAELAKEWEVDALRLAVDRALAEQMRSNIASCTGNTPRTWQYSGSHIRERAVQMLQLALQVDLPEVQAEAELFIAANWTYLSSDDRLTKDLDAASLCRVHQMADSMNLAPQHFRAVLPGGRCWARQGKQKSQAVRIRQKATK